MKEKEMRLVVAKSIEEKAKDIGISFDILYKYIVNHREIGFEKLCSPQKGIIAYKGYLGKRVRIIIFFLKEKAVIYPVYLGNKNDIIAKNIRVSTIRNNTEIWQKGIEKDFRNRQIKIRHFNTGSAKK